MKLFDWLLAVYPRGFRERFGAGMRAAFTERVGGLIACGAALGIVLSLWAAQFVRGLMFGVDARDPITLAGTASVLAGVGLLAAWLPARKASQVDPAITLNG